MIAQAIDRQLKLWLGGQSVREKLNSITILAVSCAALAAAGVILTFRVLQQRADFRAEMVTLTRVVAENAVGPASFQDAAAAETVLATLRAKSSIRGAVIALPGQPDFARYGEAPPRDQRIPDTFPARYRGWWWLHTAAPIDGGHTTLGAVHLVADLRPMLSSTLRASLLAFVIALGLGLLLSLFVLTRLRGLILDPVENLRAVTRRVTERADFTHRAEVISNDELGMLTLAFNRMLDRLQADESELRATNSRLTAEMEERRRLEAKLVEASRQAGMAQVATGVLHNVGNVLNSVNISANILRDTLTANPQVKLLRQTTDLMRAQGDGLRQFLADDPRGRLVPSLLMEVVDQLVLSRTNTVRELDEMAQNVDHIKQIVAMQQGYAKGGGVLQLVKPVDLLEEATRLAEASANRHGVRITPHFAVVPDVLTDRHQVLQILVNFITNAVQAVKVRAAGERDVVLHLTHHEGTVKFAVQDNGVGIPPENLDKIFQHGFTTRRDGHGFGLHSGALAARNLGGRVDVASAGAGLGACFTLELPLKVPATQAA